MNCQTAGQECTFASIASASLRPEAQPEIVTPAVSATSTPDQQFHTQNRLSLTPVFTPGQAADTDLNMQHLELLHHFVIETHTTFSVDVPVQDVWRVHAVRLGLPFPFLMYEILAISALHLAHTKPEQSSWYSTKSTELQTQALNFFNSAQTDIDASNCAPVFLFASLLAIHVLADRSRPMALDFSQYLDHIITCITLMRNIRKLIITDWYEFLRDTELRPIFQVQNPPKPYQIPQPCVDLSKLTDNPDLGDQAKEAYDAAIERLQWIYALSEVPNKRYDTVRWFLGWPVLLEPPFQERLNQRRPEALIILAYFGALLEYYKECWAVGNSGQYLVRAISSHLGPHWSHWMEWPLSIVGDSNDGI